MSLFESRLALLLGDAIPLVTPILPYCTYTSSEITMASLRTASGASSIQNPGSKLLKLTPFRQPPVHMLYFQPLLDNTSVAH